MKGIYVGGSGMFPLPTGGAGGNGIAAPLIGAAGKFIGADCSFSLFSSPSAGKLLL